MKQKFLQNAQPNSMGIETCQHKAWSWVAMALLFFIVPCITNAQFVKTYTAIPGCFNKGGSLIFNCITKANAPSRNFFICGMQDSSLYVAEVDPNGTIVREKLIGTNNNCMLPHTMITDRDNNLVIVGDIKASATATQYRGFLMKITPALSILFERDYNTFGRGNTVALSDVKENSTFYYLCGTTLLPNDQARLYDVLLMRVDRNTGNIINPATDIYNGQPRTGSAYDSYDALALGVDDEGTLGEINTTGRITANLARPWITKHDAATLNFTQGRRYLQTADIKAGLYSSSLIRDGRSLLTCWSGLLTGVGYFKEVGLIKADYTSLSPSTLGFMKQYFITSPKPQNEILLKSVKADALNGGYVNEGFYWTRGNDACGRALPGNLFFLKADNNGNPVWGRQFKDVLVNFYSHNSEFILVGNYIYAVGYKVDANNPSHYNGVLVQLPANNGEMDSTCTYVLNIDKTDLKYDVADSLQRMDMTLFSPGNLYPVNCLKTDRTDECNTPCDSIKLNASFELAGQTSGTNFTVTATAFSTTSNSQWIVSEVPVSGPEFNIDNDNVAWNVVGTTFGGYYNAPHTTYTSSPNFVQGHKYRFKHILSATNNCQITYTDTATKVISICTTCRTPKGGFIIVDESSSKQGTGSVSSLPTTSKDNSGKAQVYPNPAANTVTFNIQKLQVISPVLQILTQNGQVAYTQKLNNISQSVQVAKWAGGTYSYNIIANGKTVAAGNFIVQH